MEYDGQSTVVGFSITRSLRLIRIRLLVQNHATRGVKPLQNEHHWPTYRRLFAQAVNLENAGATKAALEIYYEIVDKYWPIGAEYYRRPAALLEASGDHEGALVFVQFAVLNHLHLEGEAKDSVMAEFGPWVKRLAVGFGIEESDYVVEGDESNGE